MKNHIAILWTIIMSLCCSLTIAQTADTTLKTIYEQQTIYLVSPSSSKYMKNGEKKRSGIFYQKLQKEFVNVTPETEHEIILAVRQGKIATVFSGTSLVLVSGALFIVALPVAFGIWTVGAVFLVPTIIYGVLSQRHLYKAVWLYNRDILIKK